MKAALRHFIYVLFYFTFSYRQDALNQDVKQIRLFFENFTCQRPILSFFQETVLTENTKSIGAKDSERRSSF